MGYMSRQLQLRELRRRREEEREHREKQEKEQREKVQSAADETSATALKRMNVAEAYRVAIEHLAPDLVKRLRSYDSRNHRGQYALLCREAADLIELMQRYCK
jgi:hypothetical protein